MVEQWTFNPSVGGSIPLGPTNNSNLTSGSGLMPHDHATDQIPHIFPTSDLKSLSDEVIDGLSRLALHPLHQVAVHVQRECVRGVTKPSANAVDVSTGHNPVRRGRVSQRVPLHRVAVGDFRGHDDLLVCTVEVVGLPPRTGAGREDEAAFIPD